MRHYGLVPPAPYAAAAIFLDMALSVMVLAGFLRWLAALALAILALASVGLFGAFLHVAWENLQSTDRD